MSIPDNDIESFLENLSQDRIRNILAQADARRILQEVKESSSHYPNFDSALTDKATHIAYLLLSCGCSLIENVGSKDSKIDKGFLVLERSGQILSDIYKYNVDEVESRNENLLVAGMALYAGKQYSRAFITQTSQAVKTCHS